MADSSTTIDEDEMLVLLVQNHDVLYDKSSSEYKNTQKKNDAWNEIATDMFHLTQRPTEVKDLVNKWSSLKRKFRHEHRTMTEYIPSGSSAPVTTSQWRYYQVMAFLKKHVEHRQTFSNFQNTTRAVVESSTDEDDEDGEDDEIFVSEELQDSREDGNSSDQRSAPTSACTRRPNKINNYLLVFRDAWSRIPEKNRRKCFFKLREVIREKKHQ